MKLIDILVSELPKRGGWPEGAYLACQDKNGYVKFAKIIGNLKFSRERNWGSKDGTSWMHPGKPFHGSFNYPYTADDHDRIVTKEQYEAAVANIGKSIPCRSAMVEFKPQWDRTGLPPVGAECEVYQHPEFGVRPGTAETGTKVKVVAHETTTGKNSVAVVFWSVDGAGYSDVFIAQCLRPLGAAEKNRKREDACDMIFGAMRNAERSGNMSDMADEVYDAIAAGKIPGIKLDDGK